MAKIAGANQTEFAKHDTEVKLTLLRIDLTSISFINQRKKLKGAVVLLRF